MSRFFARLPLACQLGGWNGIGGREASVFILVSSFSVDVVLGGLWLVVWVFCLLASLVVAGVVLCFLGCCCAGLLGWVLSRRCGGGGS